MYSRASTARNGRRSLRSSDGRLNACQQALRTAARFQRRVLGQEATQRRFGHFLENLQLLGRTFPIGKTVAAEAAVAWFRVALHQTGSLGLSRCRNIGKLASLPSTVGPDREKTPLRRGSPDLSKLCRYQPHRALPVWIASRGHDPDPRLERLNRRCRKPNGGRRARKAI